METSQRNKRIRNILLIAILLNGILFFSFKSEVIIGTATLEDRKFFNYHSIVIDNQVYWVDDVKNNKIEDEEMAYVYSYTVFFPNLKFITKIRPLDH